MKAPKISKKQNGNCRFNEAIDMGFLESSPGFNNKFFEYGIH